jgi:hypothetical protein
MSVDMTGDNIPVNQEEQVPTPQTPSVPTLDTGPAPDPQTALQAERMGHYFAEFDKICEQNNAVVVAMVYDPVMKKPLIYCRGSLFEATKMTVNTARLLRDKLVNDELTV